MLLLSSLFRHLGFGGSNAKNVQPIALHLCLLLVICVYLLIGAAVFTFLEHSDDDKKWNFHDSLLFAFTVSTTIGYGNIAPATVGGRLFCIGYACAGIPLVMLFIASVGNHIENKLYTLYGWMTGAKEDPVEMSSCSKVRLLCGVTLVYLLIGAVLLAVYEDDKDILVSFYFNFITLTTIGLGDFTPTKKEFLPLTLLYILFGLTLTTISINVASEYLKKLHYFGRKLKNLATTKIWFGSKTLSVNKLVGAVGKHFGLDDDAVAKLDIDQLVNDAISADEMAKPSEQITPDGHQQSRPPSTTYVNIPELNSPSDDDECEAETMPFIDRQPSKMSTPKSSPKRKTPSTQSSSPSQPASMKSQSVASVTPSPTTSLIYLPIAVTPPLQPPLVETTRLPTPSETPPLTSITPVLDQTPRSPSPLGVQARNGTPPPIVPSPPPPIVQLSPPPIRKDKSPSPPETDTPVHEVMPLQPPAVQEQADPLIFLSPDKPPLTEISTPSSSIQPSKPPPTKSRRTSRETADPKTFIEKREKAIRSVDAKLPGRRTKRSDPEKLQRLYAEEWARLSSRLLTARSGGGTTNRDGQTPSSSVTDRATSRPPSVNVS